MQQSLGSSGLGNLGCCISALDLCCSQVGLELHIGRPVGEADSGGVKKVGIDGKHVDSPPLQFFAQDCSKILNDKINQKHGKITKYTEKRAPTQTLTKS